MNNNKVEQVWKEIWNLNSFRMMVKLLKITQIYQENILFFLYAEKI
jgi:hypothetical protein